MQTFNRTIVELKLVFVNAYMKFGLTFNRTIVELKLFHRDGQGVGVIAFNRTIVELKPFQRLLVSLRFGLLIEPLWN